nr:arginine deiminase family protein [Spiroplasma clarkii]
MLFQRDPFASVGEGIILNRMWSVTRNRETLFPNFVFHNHKDFAGDLFFWYDRDETHPIEGGDVLVLNDNTLIIGISQRTELEAVKKWQSAYLPTAITKKS